MPEPADRAPCARSRGATPIWIGAVRRPPSRSPQRRCVVPPRPLTHDPLKDVLEATGNELTEVRITDVKDGVFFATVVLGSGAAGQRPAVGRRSIRALALADFGPPGIVCSEEVPSTRPAGRPLLSPVG